MVLIGSVGGAEAFLELLRREQVTVLNTDAGLISQLMMAEGAEGRYCARIGIATGHFRRRGAGAGMAPGLV